MLTLDRFSRTIPQRLRATFTPVEDSAFDAVLARLASQLDARAAAAAAPVAPPRTETARCAG